jgi:hypothetical protein
MTIAAVHFPLGYVTGQFKDAGRHLTLTEAFLYVDAGGVSIEVPRGFETDFNSVPRGLWNFFPPWEYTAAAVIHDWLYRYPGTRSRADCDAMHRRLMEIDGASRFLRVSAWSQLRAWGWKPWNEYRRNGYA